MSYSIHTLDIDLLLSSSRLGGGFMDKLSIGSYNVQRTKQLSIVARLAANYDIFFIQEFEATEQNVAAMVDFARQGRREFVTSPTGSRKINLTGIFYDSTTIELEGANELNRLSEHKEWSTDIRVKTKQGEQVVFQNFYLPSSRKEQHGPIIDDSREAFEDLRLDHRGLKLFYGGDFNHSVENTPVIEEEAVWAVYDLNNMCGDEDVAMYEPQISTLPTNKATRRNADRTFTNRRLDRFYAPTSWRTKASRYRILDPVGINSTHKMIAVEYLMESLREPRVGTPRFQFPLRRLQPPFNDQRSWPIVADATIEQAIESIQSVGKEYIQLMGYLKKKDPWYMQHLFDVNDASMGRDKTMQKGSAKSQAAKMFFQTKKREKEVKTVLSNAATGEQATTTASMLKMATSFYKELYLISGEVPFGKIGRYLRLLHARITEDQAIELNKPFTKKELEYALDTMDKSTAPGPDGIQYSVLQYYWGEIGVILTREANVMMETGSLPPGFRKVLITLISKHNVDHSTDIKDQRPISLSNTSIKVISKAVCLRLQKVMADIVGPYQRGFIRGRRINQNILEFFTMLELFKDLPEPPQEGQAVVMVDFTKAFDRISHHYLRAVMNKMGLGGPIIRLIMLIISDQEALIMINNVEGAKFPFRCGTRQGNPLSPLLFNLALEPLLVHLEALEGIPIGYRGIRIENMKYHAFADDVNIYLGNESDYHCAAKALSQFEYVSNSRVSGSKTKLFGFLPDYAAYRQRELPFPQKYLWSEDLKYLGITKDKVDWEKTRKSLVINSREHGYKHLETITKAKGTNVFVSSKVVYKDLYKCMSNQELTALDKCIHKGFFGISPERLYARPKAGGYGVLEMKVQAQGHRAAVLASTVTDARDWYTKYLRLKLVHHMARIMKRRKDTDIAKAKDLHCADFLLEQTGRFFKHLDWTFTKREQAYLKAWESTVPRTRIFPSNRLVMTTTILLTYEAPARGEGGFELTSEEEEACHPVSFKSLSKRKQKALPPVMPNTFLGLCPAANSVRRWEKFWKFLHRFEWKQHRNFEALHRFQFGSWVPMHDSKRSIAGFKCHLCLRRVESRRILRHLYNECPSSKEWWDLLNLPTPMNLNLMLAPLNSTYEQLRNLNWFVDTVRSVYSFRRKEEVGKGVSLQPLLPTQMRRWLDRIKLRGALA